MDAFINAVADFGRRLGIAGLKPGSGGTVDVAIERLGRLQLEALEDSALITLIRPWPAHAEKTARTALALCHWRENHPWEIHAGAKGDELLALTARTPLTEFDVPALERIIGYLANLLDKIEQAG